MKMNNAIIIISLMCTLNMFCVNERFDRYPQGRVGEDREMNIVRKAEAHLNSTSTETQLTALQRLDSIARTSTNIRPKQVAQLLIAERNFAKYQQTGASNYRQAAQSLINQLIPNHEGLNHEELSRFKRIRESFLATQSSTGGE